MEGKIESVQAKNKNKPKNKLIGGIISAILVGLVIMFTFLRTPQEITDTLTALTSSIPTYFLVVHAILFLILVAGLIMPKYRNYIFFVAMLLLSLSATGVSVAFFIIPNIIFFALITVLIVIAFIQKRLNFDLKKLKVWDIIVATIGIGFGFWYLHWVEDPVWLNALLYSPLGGVNCPTLVMLTGYLCLSHKTHFRNLEITVSVLTIYFGFFGIFRLQAYIDVVLVLCGGYLFAKNLITLLKKKRVKT